MAKIIKQVGTLDQDLTKAELAELAEVDATRVLDNPAYDIVQVYTALKRYELYLKGLLETLKPAALDAVRSNYNGRTTLGSATVSVTETRRFDYGSDATWQHLTNEIKALQNKRKERQQALKKLAENQVDQVDLETGEVHAASGPKVEVTERLYVSL